MAGKKKEKTLEQNFAELEEVLQSLEQEPESLEESFELYKKGMDLLQECHKTIDRVEKKLLMLEEGEEDEL